MVELRATMDEHLAEHRRPGGLGVSRTREIPSGCA